MKDRMPLHGITVDNASYAFGELSVLRNISFRAEPGEFIVLVGPSGCGKTTLLNLLSGHLQPSSGTIKKEGTTRTVYQQDGLFPWLTVSENIEMGLRELKNESERNAELKTLLELVHLEEFRDHYPHELSGGMKQRVELARALAGDADILLMDEPFSALDYQSRHRLRNELHRLLTERPRTVIFVTHDIEEAAKLADRVLVLSNRPATIVRELKINSQKPRGVDDAEVIEAMRVIMNELGLQTM
jgi:ABC-type nitrate/sulfonate/bicarbonate transport system ATPase subunit